MQNGEFTSWLVKEVNERAWSFRELGRRAGLSSSSISQVLSGENRPGLAFCLGIARALNLPPVTVARKAGLFPPLPEGNPLLDEAMYFFGRLPQEEQERAIVYLRAMVEDSERRA